MQHQIGQARGDLFLSHAYANIIHDLFECLLRNTLRRNNLFDLIILFGHAQTGYAVLQAHDGGMQRRRPLGIFRICQRLILQRYLTHAVLLDQFVDGCGIAAAYADLTHLKVCDRCARRLNITEIRIEHRLLGGQVHCARCRMEAGCITAVDLAGQHQRVIRRFQQQFLQFLSLHAYRLTR